MFWRFLIAMFCASCVGMSAFGIVLHYRDNERARATIESEAFIAHARASFDAAAPIMRLAAARPASCESALRLLLADLFPQGTLPNDGANSLQQMLSDGRASVSYTNAEGGACTYPRGSVHATASGAAHGSAADGAREGARMTAALDARAQSAQPAGPAKRSYGAVLEAAGAPGDRLAFRVRLYDPLRAMVHSPRALWSVAFSFILVLNLLCALTLVPLLVRRIRRAQRAARAWTQGDTRVRIIDEINDEFGDLTRSFNRLADSFAEVIRVKQHLAAADERNRLARDLHDTAKQRAFALSLQLTALKSSAAQAPDQRERIVATSLTLVRQLQSDLAGVIQRLSGSTLAELGIRAVLHEEMTALLDGAGIGWRIAIDDEVDGALQGAPEVTQQLLLIAIEAVANAREHARARDIGLALALDGAGFILEIRDDGRGFDVRNPARLGMGLVNMRARARTLPRGEFAVCSEPGRGTRVRVAFGLEPGPEAAPESVPASVPVTNLNGMKV